MSKKYFVDKDYAVMTEYYDFMDSDDCSPDKTKKKMEKLI